MNSFIHYLAKATAFLDWLVDIFGIDGSKDEEKEEALSAEIVVLCTKRNYEEAAASSLQNFEALANRLRHEGYNLRKIAAELDYVYSKWARAIFLEKLKQGSATVSALRIEVSLQKLAKLTEDPRFAGLRPTYERIKSVVNSELS